MPRQPELTENAIATIEVVVGILVDTTGRVLINRRPDGRHMAGAWEFPGGKREDGEAAAAALRRELHEELGITVTHATPLLDLQHRYPDRTVHLDVWWVETWSGEAVACDDQTLRWIDAAALATFPMLAADQPIVTAVLERLRRC